MKTSLFCCGFVLSFNLVVTALALSRFQKVLNVQFKAFIFLCNYFNTNVEKCQEMGEFANKYKEERKAIVIFYHHSFSLVKLIFVLEKGFAVSLLLF